MNPDQTSNSNNMAQNGAGQGGAMPNGNNAQPGANMQNAQHAQHGQAGQNMQPMQQNMQNVQGGQNMQPMQQNMQSGQNMQPGQGMQNMTNSNVAANAKKCWPLIVAWVVFGVLGALLFLGGPILLTSLHAYRNFYVQIEILGNMYAIMKWVAILAIPGLAGMEASIYFAMKQFPKSLRTIQVLSCGLVLPLIWTFAALMKMFGAITYDAIAVVLLILLLVAPIALVVLKQMDKKGKAPKITEQNNKIISYVAMGAVGLALIFSIMAIARAV